MSEQFHHMRLHIIIRAFSSPMTQLRRQGTNNKVLRMYGTIFEKFMVAAGELTDRIRTVLPEGSTKCRIRTRPHEFRA